MEIRFDKEFTDIVKVMQIVTVEADVNNIPTPDELWNELVAEGKSLQAGCKLSDINMRPAIQGTRVAYKALGKDPNRYRPSAEALSRRLVKGMELYRTTALVDLINVLSVRSGYSIGGFDARKIEGNVLTLGVGRKDESFEAIGRGSLNIECLPVYRDSLGGIGTPTSDVERTKLTDDTNRLLMCINVYRESIPIGEFVDITKDFLVRFASASNIEVAVYDVDKLTRKVF